MGYIAFLMLIFGLLFISEKVVLPNVDKTKKEKNYFLFFKILAIVLLIALPGLRAWTVGYDTANYYNNFNLINLDRNLGRAHKFESGFQFLNLIGSFIFGEYGIYFVFIVCSSIIVFSVLYSAKKMSANYLMTMFFFVSIEFYFRSFDQLRQGVAIALVVLAFTFIRDREPIAYFACIVTATLFHITALIMLPFYFLNRLTNKKNNIVFYIGSTAIIMLLIIFEGQIISFLSNNGIGLFTKQDTNIWVQDLTPIGILELVVFTLIFAFLAFLRAFLFRKEKSPKFDLFLATFYCAILFEFFSAICHKPHLYGRLIYYFFWAIIFLIPEVLSLVKNEKYRTIFKYIAYVIGISYLVFALFVVHAYGIVPYRIFM